MSKQIRRHRRHGQRGQIILLVVLVLGLFMFGVVALSVDYSNLWFHRQMAQGAADAACQAGAMDMLIMANGGGTMGGFTPGSAYSCSPSDTSAPCKYAKLNGYDGSATNAVDISFPGTVPGVTPPPSSVAPVPFMRVDINDHAPVYFSGMLTGNRTSDVRAMSTCGLVLAQAPIPIIVLHPTMQDSLSVQGTPQIIITGGPQRSIQVNSVNQTRATNVGGSGTIDLSGGGPAGTGSDLGTYGLPHTAPGGFIGGTTSHWIQPATPIADPFATLALPGQAGAPAIPANAATPVAGICYGGSYSTLPTVIGTKVCSGGTDPYCAVANTDTHNFCTRYFPGKYPTGLDVKNTNAVFVEGLYYFAGDFTMDSNSVARPSAAPGDGSSGTAFFFAGSANLNIKANSGGGKSTDPLLLFPKSAVQCPGGAPPVPPIPTDLAGNVFMAPCSGYYGDPSGTAQYRGMIFFHDRTTAVSPNMYGGGGLLVAGNIYFHQNTTFGSVMVLQGNPGSTTRVLGDIIVDQLQLGGTSTINMQLNPNAAYWVLKVALYR